MSRFVRLVAPTYPHHMVQRGIRSMDIFSDDQDRLTSTGEVNRSGADVENSGEAMS
ncbi:hypothetical protein [uncultured Desulfuromusa sp.]|uniref:hypothetical protein n=1 Tax=uncultured Desulfuromusa sp. TaxID=219183 RepID=UPI002AA7598A|nr:hypothetical protein [uncultured Desulfuromusa sp.]